MKEPSMFKLLAMEKPKVKNTAPRVKKDLLSSPYEHAPCGIRTDRVVFESSWYLAPMPKRVLLLPALHARLTEVSTS